MSTLGAERTAVQAPLLRYAEEAGWTYLPPEEALRLRRGEAGAVLYGVHTIQDTSGRWTGTCRRSTRLQAIAWVNRPYADQEGWAKTAGEEAMPVDVFKAEVQAWARRIGVEVRELHLRPMRRKWASCSASGSCSIARWAGRPLPRHARISPRAGPRPRCGCRAWCGLGGVPVPTAGCTQTGAAGWRCVSAAPRGRAVYSALALAAAQTDGSTLVRTSVGRRAGSASSPD